MADKLTANRQQQFLSRCNQLIDNTPNQVAQLATTLSDCKANWAGYAAIEADAAELQAAGIAFAGRVGGAWTTRSPTSKRRSTCSPAAWARPATPF